MPQKIHMNIFNTNSQNTAAYKMAVADVHAKQMALPAGLNSPMINRVHFSRPGCGSCGK